MRTILYETAAMTALLRHECVVASSRAALLIHRAKCRGSDVGVSYCGRRASAICDRLSVRGGVRLSADQAPEFRPACARPGGVKRVLQTKALVVRVVASDLMKAGTVLAAVKSLPSDLIRGTRCAATSCVMLLVMPNVRREIG